MQLACSPAQESRLAACSDVDCVSPIQRWLIPSSMCTWLDEYTASSGSGRTRAQVSQVPATFSRLLRLTRCSRYAGARSPRRRCMQDTSGWPFEPLFEPSRSLASCGNRASRLRPRKQSKIPRAMQVGFSAGASSAALVKSFNRLHESWRAPLDRDAGDADGAKQHQRPEERVPVFALSLL